MKLLWSWPKLSATWLIFQKVKYLMWSLLLIPDGLMRGNWTGGWEKASVLIIVDAQQDDPHEGAS